MCGGGLGSEVPGQCRSAWTVSAISRRVWLIGETCLEQRFFVYPAFGQRVFPALLFKSGFSLAQCLALEPAAGLVVFPFFPMEPPPAGLRFIAGAPGPDPVVARRGSRIAVTVTRPSVPPAPLLFTREPRTDGLFAFYHVGTRRWCPPRRLSSVKIISRALRGSRVEPLWCCERNDHP